MQKLVKVLSIFCFSLFCIYLTESACFRLVDSYANWRLHLAWGEPSRPKKNSFLDKLPLDHFVQLPTNFARPSHLGYWVGDENKYSTKVMSFTRPLRDTYEDYILNTFEPISNFEIRDYEGIQGAVLPNLKKLASIEDVKQRKARRVGDSLEFAKGVFIKIIVDDGAYSYRTEFAKLEASFGFLLEKGFACIVLPVSSGEDLLNKINNFKEKESLLAQNLFAWAEGLAVNFLMESCRMKPDIWKAIMLTDPEEMCPPPIGPKIPWVYFVIDEDQRLKEEGLDLLYEWINLARVNDNLYSSRLSGLVRIGQNFQVEKSIPSYFATYVVYITKIFEEMQYVTPRLEVLSQFDRQMERKEKEYTKSILPNVEVNRNSSFDLTRIEDSITKLEESKEIKAMTASPNFDCEIIREYRGIRENDSQLSLVSNRDLILKLGLVFEEMGKEVLDKIKIMDPLFYLYYQSLRAIEESPLN
jgi:hypothetical protein